MIRWIIGCLEAGKVSSVRMRSALGRFSYAAGALPHARPFLGPLFAWVAKLPADAVVKMPAGIRLLQRFFMGEVKRAPMILARALPHTVSDVFRIGPKAQGDWVVVGGWESYNKTPPPLARWFSIRLTRGALRKGRLSDA